ncbi:MAG: MGH1-like glycoside hydrolase domain-containing protein [Solirubrobacteraceae bacterium]
MVEARLGYTDQAQTLAAGLGKAIATSELQEYYDPYDGNGRGATDFAWSSLIIEMLDPDPRAQGSYLDGG